MRLARNGVISIIPVMSDDDAVCSHLLQSQRRLQKGNMGILDQEEGQHPHHLVTSSVRLITSTIIDMELYDASVLNNIWIINTSI
jgi:hypothetical protein